METINCDNLKEICDKNGMTIRTNDGIRKYTVIRGQYKGSTVYYDTSTEKWTLDTSIPIHIENK